MAMASIQWNWPAMRPLSPIEPDRRPAIAIMNPNLVVGAIREKNVLLRGVVRERQVVDRPAHPEQLAAGPAAFSAARGRRRMHEEAAYEFALLL